MQHRAAGGQNSARALGRLSPGRRRNGRRAGGFTLLETAVVIVIGGLLVQAVLSGAAMIKNARVRDIMAQQGGAETAVAAFQDRYHALPGDYKSASTNIDCGARACLDGNGNGRIEAGSESALREDMLAWHHLSAAGLVEGRYQYWAAADSGPAYGNTPTNAFGGLVQIVSDDVYGLDGHAAVRSNIKTGNRVPADVLAEVDRKTDDGLPGSGRFQFSTYVGAGEIPMAPAACIQAGAQVTRWNIASGTDDCGAATLLY